MKARAIFSILLAGAAISAFANRPLVAVVLSGGPNAGDISSPKSPMKILSRSARLYEGDIVTVKPARTIQAEWVTSGEVYSFAGCKFVAKVSGPLLVSGTQPILARTVKHSFSRPVEPSPATQMAGTVVTEAPRPAGDAVYDILRKRPPLRARNGPPLKEPLVAVALTGSGQLTRQGKPAIPVTPLMRINQADVITVKPEAKLRVTWTDTGGVFDLTGCKVVATQSGPQLVSGKAPVLVRKISLAFAHAMRPEDGAGQIAGQVARGGNEVTGLSPNGALLTPSITLQWPSADGAQSLNVSLFEGDRCIIDQDLAGDATSYVVPSDLLKSGERYRWTLTVMHSDGSMQLGNASFRILKAEDVALLKKLESEKGDPVMAQVLEAVRKAWGIPSGD